MSFGDRAYPTGRKRHQCAHCKGWIDKGEKHYRQVGIWEGDFQDWRMHLECENVFDEYRDYTDGFICENKHSKGKGCSDCIEELPVEKVRVTVESKGENRMDIEARSKLSVNVIHLLKLADRDCDKDGWIPASKPFWQIIHQIPEKLLERERYENGGGRVRITEAGKNVIEFTHGSFVNYSKPSEVRP